MLYHYWCRVCSSDSDDRHLHFVWEEEHGMNKKPRIKCPKCSGKTSRYFGYTKLTTYTKGNAYLDKKGAGRDREMWTLKHRDPYKHMRDPGEKDDLLIKLDKQKYAGGRYPTIKENQEMHDKMEEEAKTESEYVRPREFYEKKYKTGKYKKKK